MGGPTGRADKAGFDEKAVADFYRGEQVRIVVGFQPAAATDQFSRLIAPPVALHTRQSERVGRQYGWRPAA